MKILRRPRWRHVTGDGVVRQRSLKRTASLSSRHWTECFIKHSVSVRRNASRMCSFLRSIVIEVFLVQSLSCRSLSSRRLRRSESDDIVGIFYPNIWYQSTTFVPSEK